MPTFLSSSSPGFSPFLHLIFSAFLLSPVPHSTQILPDGRACSEIWKFENVEEALQENWCIARGIKRCPCGRFFVPREYFFSENFVFVYFGDYCTRGRLLFP
jgi:hypothetical protein